MPSQGRKSMSMVTTEGKTACKEEPEGELRTHKIECIVYKMSYICFWGRGAQ